MNTFDFMCFKLIIIAVMESMCPSSSRFPSQRSQSPLNLKIQQLQQISDRQSQQLKHLLYQQNTYTSSINTSKPQQTPSSHSFSSHNQPQTPKQRYHYQDFLEQQVQGKCGKRVYGKDHLRVPLVDVEKEIQLKQERDQQMQYLKSSQYHQYLEMITQGRHSPTNHNKNTHKTSPFFRKVSNNRSVVPALDSLPRHQPIPSFYKCSESQIRNKVRRPQPKLSRSPPISPSVQRIKTNIFEEKINQLRLSIKQPTANYIDRTPSNSSKSSSQSHHVQPSRLPRASYQPEQSSLQTQIIKPCINLYQPSPTPIITTNNLAVSSLRVETYRKELEFCNRKSYRQQEKQIKQNKRKGKSKIRLDYDKENHQSESISQRESSPSPTNTYTISYKIDPSVLKQQDNNLVKNTYRPLRQEYIPQTTKHNKKQPQQKLVTEPALSIPYRPLCESQTNSTATKTDTQTGKGRKISVVSKSRLK